MEVCNGGMNEVCIEVYREFSKRKICSLVYCNILELLLRLLKKDST